MVCAVTGAWAKPVDQDPETGRFYIGPKHDGNYFTIESGENGMSIATFHVAYAQHGNGQIKGVIDDSWNEISQKLGGVNRIKFANDCLINKADLECFLSTTQATYYVDLFDITNGENTPMKIDDYTTTADDNNVNNIDKIIEAAVADMVSSGWQAKGIILPLNTGSGTAKVETANSNGGETFTEYAVYYRETQKTATIYAHDSNMRYSWEYMNQNQPAQEHYNTAFAHLSSHSEVADAETYIVSTNNKMRGSDEGLDLSETITGNVTKISIINDELVYKNQANNGVPRNYLATITVEGVEAGAFAAAVANTGIKGTPCEKLIVQGPVNGDDVKAVNEFTTADGPLIYSLAAATGVTKDMILTITNSKLEYLVLPNAMATEQIVASDFSDALTASTNTNFKAAIAPSADSKKLSAYVKVAGSLAMARYYATGGSYSQWDNPQYYPSVTSLTDVILSGNLNASDINSGGKVGTDGHWMATGDNQALVGLNGEAATLKKMDLENAVFADQYDMNLNKAGYENLTTVVLPTSNNMTIIPANCLNNISTLKELHIPYNYKIIEDGAFWLTGINHITTEDANRALIDNGPLTYTLSNHIERLGITPTPVTNAITCPIFPQNMGVLDIYSMATKTPKCYKNVFPANSCDGWGGFLDNVPYCRDKYFNGENPLQSFAVLHFPSKETYDAARVKDDSYDLMKKYYTDVNKHFTKKEQTGAVDANGDPITWPTLEEVYRTFNQASLGLTWNDWEETYSDQGIPQVNGGQPKVQLNNGVYSRTAEAAGTGVGDYVFDEYGGWHQLVLSMATYFEPDEIVEEETVVREYEEAGWYTFCIPFNMTYKQVVEMLGVPASTDKVVNKLNGEEVTGDIMPDIRQLSSVTRKKGENGKNNIVMLRMTSNLYGLQTPGYTAYLEIVHNENSETHNLIPAEPYNAGSNIDDRLCLIGGRPYIIKAYKRKQIVNGEDIYKIKGQNIAKAILTRYADQFGIESSIVDNTKYESYLSYEQLGEGNLKTLRFAKPFEEHKVQAVRDGESSAYLTYDNNGNTYKYYYTMIGQFWQQPLPQYCLYMSRGNWYRYTDTSKGYTWDPYKCVIMATQELVKVEGDKHYGGGFRRDDEYTNYPQVEEGTDDLIKTEFKLGFLDGRDDDDFDGTGTSSRYIFGLDDDIIEFDEDGNEVTAIERLDGEDIVPAGSKVYNVAGQYVGESLNGLTKGLYIVNGKKIVVK